MGNVSKLLGLLVVFAGIAPSAWAQTQITTTSIRINSNSIPATDLLGPQGAPIAVQDAQSLRDQKFDISKLNPVTSQIWTPAAAPRQALEVSENDQVRFDSMSTSRSGNFRFNGFVQTASGQQAFQFNLSRTVHDILLRDALLRKLGYKLDPIKYLKTVRVNFSSPLETEDFILQLRAKTAGAKERFVISGTEKDTSLVLQDVVAVPAQFENYSLAYGTIPAEIIAGRRVLNSLIVPLSLVQVPESVNLLSWDGGTVFNNAVMLDSESSDGSGQTTFTTPYEDGRWAVRQLLRLTRQDFTEIVHFAQYPKEVELVLIEKIISRRNSLKKLFNIQTDDLKINSDISYGSRLQNGKITKVYADNWPGYSARFAFGDPESPLSSSQLFLLARAEFNSQVIDNLVAQFNKRVLKGTDIGSKISQKMNERLYKDIKSLVTTGQTQSSTYGVDGVPYGKYQFILSRDIVTGSYLGSDNIISSVDSIGFNITLGGYFAVYGLPSDFNASANASASLTRTYSHLTPVHSMKAALAQPFKNLLIPAVRHSMAIPLESLNALTMDKISTPEGKKIFDTAIASLKDNLSVGESLIITDSVGPSLAIQGGYGAPTSVGLNLDAYATFTAKQLVIGRTHVLRSDENTVQIYRDVGNSVTLGVGFDVSLQASLLSVKFEHMQGTTKTKFFPVPLNLSDADPAGLQKIQALVQTIRSGSLENMEDVQKPYLLEGRMTTNTANMNLLIYQWKWQSRNDLIAIHAPTGEQRDFQKRVRGTRSGTNYEDFALDVASAIVKAKLDIDVSLDRVGGTDPGDTIQGSSTSRILDYEAQIDNHRGNVGKPDDEVLKINYRWKGWLADKKKIGSIVDQINKKAGQNLFSKLALKDTQKLRLYNIQFSILVYEKGIDTLVSNITRVQKLLRNTGKFTQQENDTFIQRIKNIRAYDKKLNFNDYSQEVMAILDFMESKLPMADLINAVGPTNIFVYTSLSGFREGDEAGDQNFLSNSLGQIGSRHSLGPLSDMKSKLGITESELFASWFMEAL